MKHCVVIILFIIKVITQCSDLNLGFTFLKSFQLNQKINLERGYIKSAMVFLYNSTTKYEKI